MVAGLVLVVVGLWPVDTPVAPRRPLVWSGGWSRRGLLAVAAAVVAGLLTRWPAVALLAGALGWAAPSLLRGTATSRSAIARIEAVAAWTEMLQGLLAAAAALEQAIIASVRVAPEPIRAEVGELAEGLRGNQPLRVALGRFAQALDEPTADVVVAALRLAADPTQKVGQLRAQLAELATATRETATSSAASRSVICAISDRSHTASKARCMIRRSRSFTSSSAQKKFCRSCTHSK